MEEKKILDTIMGQDVYDSRIRPAGINGTGQPHYKYSINQFSLGQILMSYPTNFISLGHIFVMYLGVYEKMSTL